MFLVNGFKNIWFSVAVVIKTCKIENCFCSSWRNIDKISFFRVFFSLILPFEILIFGIFYWK